MLLLQAQRKLKVILENASTEILLVLQQETTCLYVDEVHRWNKLQQDSLLKGSGGGCHKVYRKHDGKPVFFGK